MKWPFPRLTSDDLALFPLDRTHVHALSEIHGLTFSRRWSDGEFEELLSKPNVFGFHLLEPADRGGRMAGFALLRHAADEAAQRALTLVHQCHVQSLFETVDEIEHRLSQIDRANFGLIFEAANLEQCAQDYGTATIQRLAPWIRPHWTAFCAARVHSVAASPSGAVSP